jgi:hypothetical protein
MRKKWRYWLPRVLAILWIIFMSIFALDAFDNPQWLLALLIHLMPSFILVVITLIAWKGERLGGILFLITGGIIGLFFHSLIIALPAFIIGFLFITRK